MNFVPGLGSSPAQASLGAPQLLLPLVYPSLCSSSGSPSDALCSLGRRASSCRQRGAGWEPLTSLRSRLVHSFCLLGLNSRSKMLINVWRTCLRELGDPPGQKGRVSVLQGQQQLFSQVKSEVCPALDLGCSIVQGRAQEYRKPLTMFPQNIFPISWSLPQNILWGKYLSFMLPMLSSSVGADG